MKVCPVKGCEAEIPAARLMCGSHWRLVPTPLQKTIWRLYADGKPKDGHLEACLSAIEQVDAKVSGRLSGSRTNAD